MVIVFAIIPIFLYIFLAFLAVVMTPLCLLAWNTPVQVGIFRFWPVGSRAFIRRGLTGGCGIVLFILFCCVMFSLPMPHDYWHHIFLAGYTAGSSFVEVVNAIARDDAPVNAPEIIEPRIIGPQQQLPPQAPPFRYASWDDEESGR